MVENAGLENNGPSSTTGKTTGSGEKAVFQPCCLIHHLPFLHWPSPPVSGLLITA